MSTNEIAHYGVKGMKWGVRKEYVPHPRTSRGGKSQKPRRTSKNVELGDVKRFVKDAKGSVVKGVAKNKGKLFVASRVAALPVTLAALAVSSPKLFNDFYREHHDTVLDPGTKFQRITATPDEKLSRIYATYNEHDNRMYRGRLGLLRMNANGGKTYVKEFEAKRGVKAPSDDTARATFRRLYDKDEAFRKYVDSMPRLVRGYVENAKSTKDLYKNFNLQGLMDRDPDNAKQVEKFYKALSKQGYNAITDLNDRYYSTFKANNPIIIFDMKNLVETNVRELGKKEVVSDLAYDSRVRLGRMVANKWLGVKGGEEGLRYLDYKDERVPHSEEDNELLHYGVKGMKWGVRKKRVSSPRDPSKRNFKRTRREYKKNLYKDLASLDDAQLQARINRMQKENQYLQLNQSRANKVGQRFVEAALVGAAVGVVSSRSQKLMNQGLDKGADYVRKLLSRDRR